MSASASQNQIEQAQLQGKLDQLLSQMEQQQQEQGSGGGGGGLPQDSDDQEQGDDNSDLGTPFDSHEVFEIKEDESGDEQVAEASEEMRDQIEREMENSIKEAFTETLEELQRKGEMEKAIGQLPAHMQLLVRGLLKSKTDKQSVTRFVNRVVSGEKRKWSKLHKRYPMIVRGKRKNRKPKLGICIDTSGSMGSEEFFMMINYQCQLLINKCEKLWIFVGDTALEYEVFVKSKKDFNADTIKFAGGGGTDLQFGWDKAEEYELDGLIVHTDGHIGNFDDKGVKSIFYLYGENSAAEIPDYENIYVYPE